jgi:NADH:ubiquinone oxidoreductase subunit 5 (subunit L)/multisubunit Na+/H+ antiporter MnhA subunit
MTIPLILLAIASIVAGYWFGFYGYVHPGATFDVGAFFADYKTWVGVIVSIAGLVVAYAIYARIEYARIHEYVESHPFLRATHQVLLRKFYFDDLYNLLIKYVVLGLSHVEQAFDTYIVDGLVNGAALVITFLGRDLRHTETGRVQAYMIGFFGGVAVLAIVVFALIALGK